MASRRPKGACSTIVRILANWPGFIVPPGFGKTARRLSVPVWALTLRSVDQRRTEPVTPCGPRANWIVI